MLLNMKNFCRKNKKLTLIVVLFLFTSSLFGEVFLDLETFLKCVEERADDIHTAKLDKEMSSAMLSEACATLFPKIELSAGYQLNIRKASMYMNLPDFDNAGVDPYTGEFLIEEKEFAFDASDKHQFEFGLRAEQLLFNMQAFSAIQTARIYKELNSMKLIEVKSIILGEAESSIWIYCYFHRFAIFFMKREK